MNKKLKGDAGEELAAKYLLQKGYEILARNFRGKHGEIDIIAQKADIISFVEVKTRTNSRFGSGAQAVTFKKQSAIIDTANEFIYKNDLYKFSFAFDIIEVNYIFGEYKINHIKNAFDTSGR